MRKIKGTSPSSSSIQTLLSASEFHRINAFGARGLYRRSGISPCPEDCIHLLANSLRTKQAFVNLNSVNQ